MKKGKMKKRILSFMAAIAMSVLLIPAAAYADESGGRRS